MVHISAKKLKTFVHLTGENINFCGLTYLIKFFNIAK